jgi:hypothetical protein
MGLEPLPPTFAATRDGLHQVAERIVAPARKPHNEIALTQTPGGFGTPPFEHEGRSLQVRVDGADIVVEEDGAERRERIESVAQAAGFVGEDLFPDGLPADSAPLDIDPEAAERLGDFYAFGARALQAFVAELSPADEATGIDLWPEHFDIALTSGPEQLGRRANYGASPGDDEHPEPYVYVGPWQPQTRGGLWNATAFDGAELGYSGLLAADDPEGAAGEFFEVRREALAD